LAVIFSAVTELVLDLGQQNRLAGTADAGEAENAALQGIDIAFQLIEQVVASRDVRSRLGPDAEVRLVYVVGAWG